MPDYIGELRARMALDGAKFSSGLRKSDREVTDFAARLRKKMSGAAQPIEAMDSAMAEMTVRAKIFGKAFAGGLIGGVAATAFAGLSSNISATVKGIAQLGDEAKRAGMSVTAFQEWKYLAEQNRIGVDALVDGFKELNLRADEFVVTGGGAAAEAFVRLGYRAEDLKTKLKDPSALMLEIMGRLKGMDKAAQIRIADEVFGGSGGEQFVQMLGQGEDALRATIAQAHKTGAVLDAELIAKAEEIDRKFTQITASAGNWAKAAVVGLVAAGAELTDFRARLDAIFDSEAEGRSIVGDEMYDTLDRNRDLVDENAEALARLDERYQTLGEEAAVAGMAMADAAGKLKSFGYDGAADAMSQAYTELQNVVQGFRDSEMSGEDFAVKLAEIEQAASDAFAELEAGDRQTFEGVMSQLGRLGGMIASVTNLANSLTGALARAAGVSPDQKAMQAMRDRHAAESASMDSLNAQREALDGFTASENARNVATKEQIALQREAEAVRKDAAAAGLGHMTDQQVTDFAMARLAGDAARNASGKGGAGGGSKAGKGRAGKSAVDDFAKEAEAIRDRTRALEAEAAVLVAVASSGAEYGDALEFARKKAELLHAAQKAGKEITPQLEAEIDKLADAYVQAALAAEGAAQRLDAIAERSRAGKDAMTDMFGSILDGSQSAKQAVGQLLAEIAKIQMMRGIFGMPGMDGISGFLGMMIGANANGTRNWQGGLTRIHERGGEIVNLPSGSQIVPHDVSMRMAEQVSASSVRVEVAPSDYFDVRVTELADQSAGRMGAQVVKSLPAQIGKYQANPRKRN